MDDETCRFAITLDDTTSGDRLDRALAARLPEFSRSRLQGLIRAGHVAVGGRTIVEPKYRVNAGDDLTVEVPPPQPATPVAQAIPLDVVYEDDALIVVDKPAGLVVHPGAGQPDGTLVNALLAHCAGSLSGIGGVERPGIVHRLDKGTSGLMVAAKTDAAHRDLAAQFADHGRDGDLQRGYLALCWGAPQRRQGIVDAPLARSRANAEKMAVTAGGRRAVTRYTVREVLAGVSGDPAAALVDCRLETGRTHQIRVHMAHIGHPLLGDPVYGAGFRTKGALLAREAQDALEGLGRQALHAYLLGFRHPVTQTVIRFESGPPAAILRLIVAMRGTSL